VLLTAMRKAASAAKVDAAVELADEVAQNKGQVVVFSAFRDSAKRVAEWFGAPAYCGDTPLDERDRIVRCFQEGIQRVFSGTFGAGGLGVTLTAASTVILLDRPMTPGDAEQSEDRLHRISQRNAVTAVWLRAFKVCRVL